ncbi:DEAD/DEAH box helicase family protein [Verrucomicrobia bacterium]|nr:DEAD/DEAH box helicase family protein [Verrucomicrobiota bacterium]
MSEEFFSKPILNSPYSYPGRHWELDKAGQPSGNITDKRRPCSYLTPIPRSRRGNNQDDQMELIEQDKVLFDGQEYDPTSIVNQVRSQVDKWRKLSESQWGVTPATARLLRHWRTHDFSTIKPFFCQIEAVETAIWLAEVAPKLKKKFDYSKYLKAVNAEVNPELFRIALKLATGAGKTMVMAMLIAWQTVNAVRTPNSKKYSRSFLIIAPGITIRDRLRVLLPNDMESYYRDREILPRDMLGDIEKAKIVITNYHAFQRREKMDVSKGGRALLKGKTGKAINTKETEGEMVRRVMGELMGDKIIVINDEAHHCYRTKSGKDAVDTEDELKGDEKVEAKNENEFARMWITGIETIKKQTGVVAVYDLSATPFFLSGSGYREGTLFPWVMSDFSLMDAIESGIVKLPRVPIQDNVSDSDDTPKLRNIWQHIGKKMPKGKGGKNYDPKQLPALLQTGLQALYGHYEKTFDIWGNAGVQVPPVFVVVCNNVKTSKAVYDWISGWEWENDDGTITQNEPRLKLFGNFDENFIRRPRPRTLLIDSRQLESGDALDTNFRKVYADEIEKFRREKVERTGNIDEGKKINDSELLREVLNTVGQKGKLGGDIRCVVSVSMLTEGWDANTVTHIFGIRAFGTQLLCEQVVGRGLRRLNYTTDDEDKFAVEYADILGIPFDFTAKSTAGPILPPPPHEQIHAVRPERDHLEIIFPNVDGYRIDLPKETIKAEFNDDSKITLSPAEVGPTNTTLQGMVGEGIELTVETLASIRVSAISYELAKELLFRKYTDGDGQPRMHLFLPLQRVARQWINECVECVGGAQLAQLLYPSILDDSCEKIRAAITDAYLEEKPVLAIIDPYNPIGSTSSVNFRTTKTKLWDADPDKCHINKVVCDSDWEQFFCRAVERHPRVLRYVKNQSLGFEVPYRSGDENRRYLPDFIVVVNLGNEENEILLNLIVEIKGLRRESDKQKQNTIKTYWVPGVNNLKTYGRWAFAEFRNPETMDDQLEDVITGYVNEMIEGVVETEISNNTK